MNKRRKFTALLGILICVALLMSCKKNDTGEETYELYYVNVQTQALEQEKVQIEGDTTEEKIESMLKELKKNPEDVEVKEEAVETAEQAESASPVKSELELANERAEDFENKYLRAHAEMQNIQRRANEERQQLQKYRSQDLAKAILPSLDNLERALAVEGLTDDVKKGLEMVQESLVHALKEEGIEEIPADGAFDHNYHMAIQTLPADDEHPADTIAQVFQKGYKLHDRILRPAMVVVYN